MKTSSPSLLKFKRPIIWSASLLAIYLIYYFFGALSMKQEPTKENLKQYLDSYTSSNVPGLQYMVVDANDTLFQYSGGWADIQNQKRIQPDTTLMVYSMTKTFTAVAILQLVEDGKINLDDEMDMYLPDTPYQGKHITIRQLLSHTAGIPNPIPLRWIHLAEEDANFDTDAALAQVLRDNPELDSEPGEVFSYSNIGYWLLGEVIEKASGQPYRDYVRENILAPLQIPQGEMDFVILDPELHAKGYLARFSFTNLAKGFVTDSKFWGAYEGNWLMLKSNYLNSSATGGLLGTPHGFSLFLQDQLRAESVLLNPESRKLLISQQTDNAGNLIPMTLGWHIGETDGVLYYFKEGGGGGFHSEMRIYPSLNIATLVMVNSTDFNSNRFLNNVDSIFLNERQK